MDCEDAAAKKDNRHMRTLTKIQESANRLIALEAKRHELRVKLINTLTYLAALKLNGIDKGDVARVVRELAYTRTNPETGEVKKIDATQWNNSAMASRRFRAMETGMVAGVILKCGKVVKFECPIGRWF